VPGYREISSVATQLVTDVTTLLDFMKRGWIKTAERSGSVFIAADQGYRAKYILHLRQKKGLSDQQIELVLSVQRPPYSAADVDRILCEHGLAGSSAATGRPGKDAQRMGGSGGA